MSSIKITSKRQATLPVSLCNEMGVKPGDELLVESTMINNELVWIIKPTDNKLSWMGSLKKYARNKSFDLNDMRKSVSNARYK